MLNRFVHSPLVNLSSGLILLMTSGYETWMTLEEFRIGAHHGVLLFSIIQLLKSLPEVLQSSKEINEAIS